MPSWPLNITVGLLLVALTFLDTQISLREGWEGSGWLQSHYFCTQIEIKDHFHSRCWKCLGSLLPRILSMLSF